MIKIMKKKAIIYVCLTAFVLSFYSCMDLNEEVYGTLPADEFLKTEEEVSSAVGYLYRQFNKYNNYVSGTWLRLDCAGDMPIVPTRIGGDWWDSGQYRELHMHDWTERNISIRESWELATQTISSCNLVYENVSGSEEVDADFRRRVLAEIRGIRAFWIYLMMDAWGSVPLVTSYKDATLPSLTPRADVYEFLIEELNEIKDLLRSDVTTSSAYGKFTKGSALMLLAKIYLNAEAWGVDSPRWQEVVDICTEIEALGYVIEPEWDTNFQATNNSSREAILVACHSTNDEGDYRQHLFEWSHHYKGGEALGYLSSPNNGLSAQPDYVKLFDENDKRREGSFLIGQLYDANTGEPLYTAYERLLNHTVDITVLDGYEREKGWGDVHQEDGARIWKWKVERGTLSAMNNDMAIFRYSDVKLMKAEALVRMGGSNAEATNLVNEVRSRGFGNTDYNYTSVTLADIEVERKLEFAWECMSRQDCIRFGTFQNARFLKFDTTGDDYKNLFPIPYTAYQTNNNLVQNPGYPMFSGQ